MAACIRRGTEFPLIIYARSIHNGGRAQTGDFEASGNRIGGGSRLIGYNSDSFSEKGVHQGAFAGIPDSHQYDP